MVFFFFFFFNDTATTEIYTLSLHDALPIYHGAQVFEFERLLDAALRGPVEELLRARGERAARHEDHPFGLDRKSTRLNSSHSQISYAVFCLKKKKRFHHVLPKNIIHYTLIE